MPRDNVARYVLLGILSHESMSGYDIKKRVDTAMSHFYDISYGQIYPTLRSLEEEGLVTMSLELGDSSPNRKVYTITEEGRMVLREWVAIPPRPETYRYEVLLKLFFADQVGPEVLVGHIKEFRERNQRSLELMDGFEENLRSVLDQSDAHAYMLMVVLMGKEVYSAHVRWADMVIQMLVEARLGGEVDG